MSLDIVVGICDLGFNIDGIDLTTRKVEFIFCADEILNRMGTTNQINDLNLVIKKEEDDLYLNEIDLVLNKYLGIC